MTDQLTWTPPEIEIEGKTYQLRRLGIRDIFKLGKIWSAAQARAATATVQGMTAEQAGMLLMAMLPYEGEAIIEFLADAIGVKAEELSDPDVFPLGSELQIIQALVEHEDVRAFFGRFRALMADGGIRGIAGRSADKSTGSKGKQAGGTKKS